MDVRAAPERPLLKPWYRLAREGDRIALEYGHAVVSFGGRAAGLLLPALLPLLDGTRTAGEIAACLGEPAAPAIDNALEALARAGLLIEGPPLDGGVPRPQAGTVELLAATAPSPGCLSEISAVLARATVGVAGSGASAQGVARLLRLSGVSHVEPLAWDDARDSLDRLELVVAVPEAGELSSLERCNRAALAAGRSWLQVLPFDGRYAAVGPLYVPGETCCFECYRLRRASNVGYPEEFWALERSPAPFPSAPPLEHVVAGLAVYASLRWLVHRDPALAGRFYAVEQKEALGLSLHHVYRVPRCPACSGEAGRGAPLPWFEAALDEHR